MVYETLSVSPFTTLRSPGEVKSEAENSVPVLPLLVLLLNAAGEAEFVTTEGLALVAATNVAVGRLALLYPVSSVQVPCEPIVLLAAGALEAPAPYRPIYHEVI